jgi:hypothetical protein
MPDCQLRDSPNIDCRLCTVVLAGAGASLDLASVAPAPPVPDFAAVQSKKLVERRKKLIIGLKSFEKCFQHLQLGLLGTRGERRAVSCLRSIRGDNWLAKSIALSPENINLRSCLMCFCFRHDGFFYPFLCGSGYES